MDEEHPTLSGDSYAMSKVVGEATVRSFQHRSGADIYGLRINNAIEPHGYAELFPDFVRDPGLRRRNVFACIDARDPGRMVECCLAADGPGCEVFDVANPNPSVDLTSGEIAARFYQGASGSAGWRRTKRSVRSRRRGGWWISRPNATGAPSLAAEGSRAQAQGGRAPVDLNIGRRRG